MLERLWTHCMLRPTDLQPRYEGMKIIGTFNPGVVRTEKETVLLVRVCEAPIEQRDGQHPSPRMQADGTLVTDWFNECDCDLADPRVITRKTDGCTRLRFFSYLRVFRSSDGKTIDNLDAPCIEPAGEYETYGIEDPRITRIGDTYYITYVAVSAHGVATALMSTTDFVSFKRHGIIFAPENKDVVLFPQKILGQYVAMHRPVPSMRFVPPEMWLARSPDLIHWGGHTQLASGDTNLNLGRVGGGTPPICTREGYLTLYHGAEKREGSGGVGVYTASALLLDSDNPAKVIGQSEPVFEPTLDFETEGFVDQVVFPTALVEQDEEVWAYYGAADENVGVVAWRRKDLFAALG